MGSKNKLSQAPRSPWRRFRSALQLLSLGALIAGALLWTLTRRHDSAQAPRALRSLALKVTGEGTRGARITLQATPRAEAGLPKLKAMMSESLALVEAQLGMSLSEPITIKLAEDVEEMKALAKQEQGWSPPEWANGLAYPHKRVIYLHRDHDRGLERTLRHELAHIAVAELELPLWLNEGLAVWASERVSFERMKALAQARLTGDLIPISTLSRSFPSSPTRAQLAYAESAHFVTHLADQEGHAALHKLLRGLASGEPLARASELSFGRSLRELEGEWRAELTHGRLEGLSSLAQEGVPMALGLAFVTIIGLISSLLLALKRRFSLALEEEPRSQAHKERLSGVRVLRRREPHQER